MLVEQQQLGRHHGGHEQCQRLALTAGQKPHRTLHPVLQSHPQQRELLAEFLPVGAAHPAENRMSGPRRTQIGNGEILLNAHIGRRALQRILKQVADRAAAAVLLLKGHILAVEHNGALVHIKAAGDGVKHGGFTRAVGAHHGGKITVLEIQRQMI